MPWHLWPNSRLSETINNTNYLRYRNPNTYYTRARYVDSGMHTDQENMDAEMMRSHCLRYLQRLRIAFEVFSTSVEEQGQILPIESWPAAVTIMANTLKEQMKQAVEVSLANVASAINDLGDEQRKMSASKVWRKNFDVIQRGFVQGLTADGVERLMHFRDGARLNWDVIVSANVHVANEYMKAVNLLLSSSLPAREFDPASRTVTRTSPTTSVLRRIPGDTELAVTGPMQGEQKPSKSKKGKSSKSTRASTYEDAPRSPRPEPETLDQALARPMSMLEYTSNSATTREPAPVQLTEPTQPPQEYTQPTPYPPSFDSYPPSPVFAGQAWPHVQPVYTDHPAAAAPVAELPAWPDGSRAEPGSGIEREGYRT
ncbi:hypothetical protein DFH27DRAFT_555045 [Peziza echinospora]|nr:hypothetical protein DFH27DRAFT_555045 [Peziza echinospora]